MKHSSIQAWRFTVDAEPPKTGIQSKTSPLRAWQTRNLPKLREFAFTESRYPEVTLLAYSFPLPGAETEWFSHLEASILQTWRMLGRMRTVIVVHRRFEAAEAFGARWSNVELQEEPTLRPGDIWSMTLDCIARLGDRFQTRYCLIVQDDSFPIASNLGDFLGKWDYIAPPFVRDIPRQHLADLIGFSVGIGGFSLRSKRLCCSAARHWRWGWHRLYRKSWWFSEDIFYTITLRLLSPLYRLLQRFPTARQAACFAVDINAQRQPQTPPFGFHGSETFTLLQEKGWQPDDLA